MSKSEKNLAEAFAGESQANRKYLAFAKKADEEGLTQVARLFRAAAAAETIHALAHLRVLKGVGGTADNLKEAIGGETHEFTDMYPQMIADAKEEDNKGALMSFMYANAVEKIHAALYQKALAAMSDLAETAYFVCDVCGNTVEGEAPDRCPICGMSKDHFMKID
ncbi:rubrerythrin family protein [bacterium]|nr:rubrerythrin family protein [bacterium]